MARWMGFRRRLYARLGMSLLAACLLPAAASAQLEVLLRGVQPSLPEAGNCARYRFESSEPDGSRQTEFIACVESVPYPAGPVILLLSAAPSSGWVMRLPVGGLVSADMRSLLQPAQKSRHGTATTIRTATHLPVLRSNIESVSFPRGESE